MEEIKLTTKEKCNEPINEILSNIFNTVSHEEKALTININDVRIIMFPDREE